MWNRIKKLESAIEDRPKSAQAGREIAKLFFLKAIISHCFEVVFVGTPAHFHTVRPMSQIFH